VTRPRTIFCLQVGVAGLGILAIVAAGLPLAGNATFAAPSVEALVHACRNFVLPDLSLAAIVALALSSAAFAVLVLAGCSFLRQHRASRHLLARLPVVETRELAGQSVCVIAAADVQAFCAGLLRPKVYLSTAALSALDTEQLRAVIAHEAHHARQRDPLRIMFARVLGDSLFFLPALRRLGDAYARVAELAADRAAIGASRGDARPLAGALLTFGEGPGPAVVGIAPERVDHLLGQQPVVQLPVALLALSAAFTLAVVIVSQRVADAAAMAPIDVPLVASQLCMLLMAVLPPAAGGMALLRARRALIGRAV